MFSSVNNQLIKGHVRITLPTVLMIIGLPALLGYVLSQLNWLVILAGLIGGVYLGYRLAWAYWGREIVKWRLHSFSTVSENDWLVLYRAAVRQKLIWPTGHYYEQFEARSEEAKEQLDLIDERLAELRQVEMINEDFVTPKQVEFKAKSASIFWVACIYLFPTILGGNVLLDSNGISIIGWFVLGVGLYGFYRHYPYLRLLFFRQPVLVFGPQKIEYHLYGTFCTDWASITQINLPDGLLVMTVEYQNDEISEIAKINLDYIAVGSEVQFRSTLKTFINRHCA